jgi:hypothetical protein
LIKQIINSFSSKSTNTIIINGQKHVVSGSNISIGNNVIMVDGVVVQGDLSGIVEVKFEGDLANVTAGSSITVNGNIHGDADAGSHIRCNDIGGDADAGSHITARDIKGDADAGSHISCRSH